MSLKDKILNKETGIILYGLTPPKEKNTTDRIVEISQKQISRIKNLDIDGLVLYDIQDESDRIKEERPFPFLPTIDPAIYSRNYLDELKIPKIVYRCVGKYNEDEFSKWLTSDIKTDRFSVFVGAASKDQDVNLKLREAYELRQKLNPNLLLGGVTIPERHSQSENEHLRVLSKIKSGCKFFVSQAVYNLEYSKNFLSDYYHYCQENNLEMVPIIFTFTPCGSKKTLNFMKWLGINIAKWLENDLLNSEDILEQSLNSSKKIFEELLDYALEKGIPIGCNIESLSIRKAEIEASIELAEFVKETFKKKVNKI
ncbi:5,10-methylenetetrahydrofolate reductase [Orenia metallireducens]|jgi:hypothetical protein|uniref:Methylenetetrahydrofolate reductase n=1 Tax=Orenia metallireducens TaxID=1413210 RepID=A0A1C0A781_9FIRM|nr:methylenetetrahydrofolate reductase [Orenia metallireducens]OCL26107.1 5,10-methylenetetrahydrofolate reductase [Orenia metallireducens]